MKKLTKISASAIIVIGFSLNSFGQATGHASASATIMIPISIVHVADLAFGNVAVQAGTAGTVIMSTAGARSTGGAGGVTLPSVTGTFNAAAFTVNGDGASTYAITLPATVTINSGGNNMTVNAFTSNPSGTGALTLGTQSLLIGATLNVSAGQAPGTYTNASWDVIVNYN